MLSWIAVVLSAVLAGLWCIDSLLRGKKSRYGCALPPGPKGLPLVGHLHMLSDLPHRDLHKLAQKHGSIMHIRLGVVPTIVVSSPEAAELFLKTHDVVFTNRPKMEAVRNLNYWEKDVIFAQYGPHWRNMRKICTLQLLTGTKIKTMNPVRKEDIGNFIWRLRDAAEANAVVDLSERLGLLLEDMLYGFIFGRKYDMLDFKTITREVLSLLGAFNIGDYIPLLGLLDFQVQSKIVDGLLENIIEEHVNNVRGKQYVGEHTNFIDLMLSLTESDSEHPLDRISMKTIIMDMILAAIESSSVTIEWALSELLRHPEIMKRVQSELENVIGMDRMVDESDLAKLDYFDLVVKESMRLHPIAPLLVPHGSREDININGYYIPKQSRILVNVWAIGHDPNVWSPNVEEFYPERFSEINVDFSGHDFRFLPFGSGRRGCPGVQTGVTMVRMILHCFNWEIPDGISPTDLDMKEKPGISTPRAKPLLVTPTFRLHI